MTAIAVPSIRSRALAELLEAGLAVTPVACREGDPDCLRGTLDAKTAIAILRADPDHWQEVPIRSGYHEDLGPDRVEFRSYTRVTFGSPVIERGSVQVVIGPSKGEVYADVDRHNPTQDVAGMFGHGFGKDDGLSIGKFFRWLWRKVR